QAEDGVYVGKTDTQHAGYTGTGFVDFTNAAGSSLLLEFSLAEALPTATVLVRWANGKDDDRSMSFRVNDSLQIESQAFGNSGAFTTWVETAVTLNLRKGTNKLLMTALTSNGGPNMDKITIVGGEEGLREYALNLQIQGKGRVLKMPDAPYYPQGTVVQLEAVPDTAAGAEFVGWSGDLSGSDAIESINMDAEKTVIATFKSNRHSVFYCAPPEKGGNDNNEGSIEAPFFNVSKALSLMEPGDTLYLRGGTYRYTATIALDQRGSELERLCIFNYPGESPVLNFYDIFSTYTNLSSSARGSARGFKITGDYYYLKGLEICQAPDNGIKIEGSHNICELLILHHNGDSGIQIGLGKDDPDAPDQVANNLIKNCDSYRNLDWGTTYENADGFACKLSPGANNRFTGCRAWQNADDGWDFYMTHYPIYLDSCWTFGNGNPDLASKEDLDWEFGQNNTIPTSWSGDGNGFKLGGDGWAAKHEIRNCIAFDGHQTGAGFNENNNADSLFIFNCVSWQGIKNYRVRAYPSDIRNCISFDAKNSGQDQLYNLAEGTVSLNNSWDQIEGNVLVPYQTTTNELFDQKSIYDEFVSTSKEDFLAPRQADGSLPDNGFGRLKANSIFIDRGSNIVRGVDPVNFRPMDIELSNYFGLAVDLGAYEYVQPDGLPRIRPLSPRLQASPNPCLQNCIIEMEFTEKGSAELLVFDLAGKKRYTQTIDQVMAGEKRRLQLDIPLPSGVYQLVLLNGKTREMLKLIKL
ncbi:MAG: right-handed parallel beta-helix repeat-containing protein, partial [Bacteroidales bacterium]